MENQDTRTFKIDPSIEMKPVRFKNRFGIELAGHLYLPENYAAQKNAAIIVAGPFGAVKEQAAGLYAQRLASMGFVSLAFDPSFGGESGGEVRNIASPDIFTEDYSAAVDYIGLLDYVDRNRMGRWAFAACPAWPLPPPGLTPASRRLPRFPCTICPAI